MAFYALHCVRNDLVGWIATSMDEQHSEF